MNAVRRHARPELRRPRAVVAFEGWNDACEAASGAAAYLLDQEHITQPFVTIEPEEFFDFHEHRPIVTIEDGDTRRLTWPDTHFFAIPRPGSPHDLVVVTGEEPTHRWKTFARSVTQVLVEADVESVVLLGAYIGQVTHHQPTPLVGVATDPALVRRHGLEPSAYEGPTGIIGVLAEACREVGLPALSIWAATPHYLAANPNPTAMLALVRKTIEVLGVDVDLRRLIELESDFVEQVEEAIGQSDDLAEYIATIEADGHMVAADGTRDELVTEIEDFLRKHG